MVGSSHSGGRDGAEDESGDSQMQARRWASFEGGKAQQKVLTQTELGAMEFRKL